MTRKEAWEEYMKTGENHSEHDLNDYDQIAAITGWNVGSGNNEDK